MAKPIKRKLKSVHDPKMGSTSAAVSRKKNTAAAPAAPAAPATPKPKRTTKAKPAADITAADKDFNNKRRKVLADRKDGQKAGVT